MREVAQRAGVSVQTVSNHVNGRHQFMSKQTRERVAAAMQELGYHPNLTARGLRSAQTRTLGFLVFDPHARFLADPATGLVMAGVGDVARERDYGVLIKSPKSLEDSDELLAPILESRVDGAFLLLAGDPAARERHIRRTVEVTDRFVVFDEPTPSPAVMSVSAANRAGGYDLTTHLIERGHRRIAFIGTAVSWAAVEQRYAGFEDALRTAGIAPDPDLVKHAAGWEPTSGVPIIERLLRARERPSAIVCASDLLSLAALHTARRLGADVPADVAVAGFDDLFGDLIQPSLTTVRVPAYEMGREAAGLLIAELHGELDPAADRQLELPVQLVVREST
jgi:LacI family transcriptional regulator/LacI family repressor for deo operon, udp, cdd, tsx, nupC, and nupG